MASQSPQVTGTNTAATVTWGSGGATGLGQLSLAVNGNYTWSYYVNVVGITIVTPADGAYTGNFASNGFTAIGKSLKTIGSNQMMAAGAQSPTVTMQATVTLQSPAGNNNDWGVDQMLVSFSQLLTASTATATYSDSTTLALNFATPVRDQNASDVTSWYAEGLGDGVGSGQLAGTSGIMKNPLTTAQKITASDSPNVLAPAYHNQAATDQAGDSPIGGALTASDSFTDYVCAGVLDMNPSGGANNGSGSLWSPLNNVYTRLASCAWTVNYSGSFDASFAWTGNSNTGVTFPALNSWTLITTGGTIDTSMNTSAQSLANQTWQ